MAETYRDILIMICLGLLGWGLIRTERIYQYPFFMGSMFISFILPQAFSLIDNPGLASEKALARVLLMSCLCAAACWIGYQIKPNSKLLAKLYIKIDDHKLFQAAIVLMILGYFFWFLLNRKLTSGTVEQASSNGNWTGPATIYFFFMQTIYIAFAIFLLFFFKTPNITNMVFVMISGKIPLDSLLGGRRQPTMTFIMIIGLSIWLIRRREPSRLLIMGGVAILIVIIPLMGALRAGFWELVFSGQWQKLLSLSSEALSSQQKGDILELRNAALYMDAAATLDLYGFGAGWWDAIIFQFVPGQIVGFWLKAALQFQIITEQTVLNLYGYHFHPGTTITGIADSFKEFGYLGCLSFAVIGYMFKNLWVSANYSENFIIRVLYLGLISPAMVSVSHGIGRFFQEAIFQSIFVGLAAYYSRKI